MTNIIQLIPDQKVAKIPEDYEKYYWIITADITNPDDANEDRGDVGIWGPKQGHRLSAFNRQGNIPMTYFRMLDDDGAVYYYGILYGEFTGLEPLDDFGTPNAGCTIIQHLGPEGIWISI